MKKIDLFIIVGLASLTVATVLLTDFFYVATIEPTEEKEDPQEYEFREQKDWFLDSTFTEKRHIYYETQSKLR
jgi:hypothetical protein